jgi:uncharacterized repeat protein (TIGR01451 family)
MISPAGDNLLRLINPASGSIFSVPISLEGKTVKGGTGLATNPVDGKLYALLEVEGLTTRQLATVDAVGTATLIGPADDGSGTLLFADVTFASDGTLYGVTTAHNLYRLDISTGLATLVMSISLPPISGIGNAIAYNAEEHRIYYATSYYDPEYDASGVQWMSLDPLSSSTPPLVLPSPRQYVLPATALLHWVGDLFQWVGQNHLRAIRTNGSVSSESLLPATAAGLAPATPLPSTFTLTVTRAGTGTGTVISQPAGIDCGAKCSASFSAGTDVVLSASPDSGSVLTGWSGCSGFPNCTVSMFASLTATALFAVAPQADVQLTLTGPSTGVPGGILTYQLIARNGGPEVATNFVVTNTLPAGTTFVSATPNRGCSHSNDVVICTPNVSLGAGSSYFFIEFVVTANSPGTITDTVSVTAAVVDPDLTNNSASLSTTISNPPGPDTSPPTVAVTAPSAGTTVSGSTVSVTATATDNVAVVGVQFKLDGAAIAEDTVPPYAIMWDTSFITNGPHTLSADARDSAGNHNTASISVLVDNAVNPPPDTVAPNISITGPTAGGTVSGPAVTIAATAFDNVGVVGVQFKLDGTNWGMEDTTSPYSLAWDSTKATNGVHTLTASARDAAGNIGVTAAVTVTVSNSTEFNLTPAPGSSTSAAATPGGTATFMLNVAPTTGFTGLIAFTCTGAPQTATCTITPNPANVSGTAATLITVTITTAKRSVTGPLTTASGSDGPRPLGRYGELTWIALIAVAVLPRRTGRLSHLRSGGIAFLCLLLMLMIACGGGGLGTTSTLSPPAQTGTPAGTYTISVTGTSSGLAHAVNLTLTVN